MPQNIVVLSDGTGNAAASIWRTNVWRVFQAIDLTKSEQVACYDDGVGTSSFKPLAILGGAFGWGLKRNVLHLYRFLCRNYEPGAKIFGFGFSRGAFTIRVLVGLVESEGLIPYLTEDDLARKAVAAYRVYRRKHVGAGIGTVLRPLRDLIVAIGNFLTGRKRYNDKANTKNPSMAFLGLWDTVAAYGLPVDEWTMGISKYIWPLELPGRKLWFKVERACHALSLDDERTTFHPVLWDESSALEGQICQVWFAGVHANVGGGYPDDSLAGVPLLWIMREAAQCGLRFKTTPTQEPDALRTARSAQDKDGRLYDSRTGLASYYRYGPRDVEDLCNDSEHGVHIRNPIIHESVFARIQGEATAYGPLGLPRKYLVAREDGAIVAATPVNSESEDQIKTRSNLQPLAWNVVWWRRIVYFLTVIASLNLVAFPLRYGVNRSEEYTTSFRLVPETVRSIGAFLPKFVTDAWLNSYATNPKTLSVSILAIILLTLIGLRLRTITTDRMLAGWRGTTVSRNGFIRILDELVLGLRTSDWYRGIIKSTKYRFAPLFFAIFTVLCCAAFVSHMAFYFADAAGYTCQPTPNAVQLPLGQTSPALTFPANEECWPTGVKLTEGVRYVITIKDASDWQIGDYSVDLGGVDFRDLPTVGLRTKFFLLTPLRRVLLRPWFRVIARVGETGTDEDFVDPDQDILPGHVNELGEPLVPHRSGELYLYVNDAVLPLFMNTFYRHNHGTATVTITQKDKR